MLHSNQNSTGNPSAKKRSLLIEQLEERALFDAVPVAPIDANSVELDASGYVHSAAESLSSDARQASSQQEQQERKEVLFVDKSVDGFEKLVAEFMEGRDIDLFFLNQETSGFTQIANHLSGRSEIQAIHIVSHANDAQLNLGGSVIQRGQLSTTHGSDLIRIGQALSETGDILIYGCDLAASLEGEAFIQELSQLTNADVAASSDLTGAQAAGGDWDLETHVGKVDAQSLASVSFQGTLLETDAGFVVGTASFAGMNEVAVTPLSQGGTSSRTYANAATADNGAITIDLRMTLIDTFDENGDVTTGTADQMPLTFTDFAGGPVILARVPGASVSGYEGHTAHVLIEFFDAANGSPLSVVGHFTFKDIDHEAPSSTGSGSEAVTMVSDQMQSYAISRSPTSSIETIDNGSGTTTFTNTTTQGGEADQQRWINVKFVDMPQLNLTFTVRDANTGYGMSTTDFSATPLTFARPDATDDNFATNQNSWVLGNVMTIDNGSGADSDPDGNALTVTLVNGVAANVGSAVAGSSGGSFLINANGSFSFNPGGAFDYLAAGESATTRVTYQVNDGTGLADNATVTVTVTGANDNPIVSEPIPTQSNNDGDLLTPFNISGFFADVDATDTLTFNAGTTLPPGLSLDSTTGIISGTINRSASTGGPYTVVISASDGKGGSISQSFNWLVANPGPTATNNAANVKEDTDPTDIGNLINDDDGNGVDSDPDNDPIFVNAVNGTAANVGVSTNGTYGSVVIASDGSYTYTLDDTNATVNSLSDSETLVDSFTYTVSDGEGGTSTATLTIDIDGTNDAPVVSGTIPSQTNDDADTITAVDVTSAFSDPEGDTLTFTATGLPAGLTLDLNSGRITGTIDNSASQGGPLSDGVYLVAVIATDDSGASVPTTFTWTVTNPGPTANDDSGFTDEATSTLGNVIIGSDSDPDGDTLTVNAVNGLPANVGSVVNGSSGGQFVINSDGSYTFDPNGDFEDLDRFELRTSTVTYTITDGEGGTDSATLTITVNGINDVPVVSGTIPSQTNDDADTITAVDVTSAFSDPEGDTLIYTATGLPAGLTLDLNSGQITGTIDNSASQGGPLSDGVYLVEVIATDDSGASVPTTFTWTVTNPGPTANDDSGFTDEATSTLGNVIIGSDSDPDGDTLTVNAVNGLPANVGSVVNGSNGGQFTINSDGSYTFDPNGNFEDLDVGELRNTTVTYTITDREGGTDSATLTITVNGINDVPVVSGTIPAQANDDADTITAVDVTSAFSDPEGDTLIYTATGLPAGLTLDLNSGQITGTIDNSASQGGPLSDGVYLVAVIATDDNGASVSTTFIWTVTNPGPTATDNSGNVVEDDSLIDRGNVITDDDGFGVDADPDGDVLSVTALNGSTASVGVLVNGSYGTILLGQDGSYTYTLDNTNPAVSGMASGDTLTDVFTYTVSDGEGGSSTASISISIKSTNDAPTASSIPDQSSFDSDSPFLDVSPYFTDPDGDALMFVANGLPVGLSIDANSGVISGLIGSSASQGGPNLDGVYEVEIVASDGDGQSVSTTFSWSVSNPVPVAVDDSFTIDEDTTLLNTVSTNDSDRDGDSVLFKLTGAGVSHGSIVWNTDGSFTYTPDSDFHGTDLFDYSMTDADGATTFATVTITVAPLNDAPIAKNDTITTTEDTPVLGSVAGNDSDPDGDRLVFKATRPPANGSLSFDPDGSFSFVPNPGFVGTTTFEYEVCDADGLCDTATVTLNVTPLNDAPVARDDSGLTGESSTVVIDLLDNDWDPDSDPITVIEINGVSAVSGTTVLLPSGAEVTLNADGTVSYNTNGQYEDLRDGQSALDTFLYTITDGKGETSVAEAVIVINGENDAPIAEDDFVKTKVGTPVTINVIGNDYDPDGQPLTVILMNQPVDGWCTLNSDGTITYQPNPEFKGTVTFDYLVEDPDGSSSVATVTVEVEPDFAYDSFNNFSQIPNLLLVDKPVSNYGLLSQEIFTLAPEPIFSGYARPGTQIVGRIYDASGALVGEATADCDPGGNWMMQFPGAKGYDFYRIEFEQFSSGAADIYGYLGLYPGDNSYQSMEPMTVYDRPLTVEGAMETSQAALQASQRENSHPLGFGI